MEDAAEIISIEPPAEPVEPVELEKCEFPCLELNNNCRYTFEKMATVARGMKMLSVTDKNKLGREVNESGMLKQWTGMLRPEMGGEIAATEEAKRLAFDICYVLMRFACSKNMKNPKEDDWMRRDDKYSNVCTEALDVIVEHNVQSEKTEAVFDHYANNISSKNKDEPSEGGEFWRMLECVNPLDILRCQTSPQEESLQEIVKLRIRSLKKTFPSVNWEKILFENCFAKHDDELQQWEKRAVDILSTALSTGCSAVNKSVLYTGCRSMSICCLEDKAKRGKESAVAWWGLLKKDDCNVYAAMLDHTDNFKGSRLYGTLALQCPYIFENGNFVPGVVQFKDLKYEQTKNEFLPPADCCAARMEKQIENAWALTASVIDTVKKIEQILADEVLPSHEEEKFRRVIQLFCNEENMKSLKANIERKIVDQKDNATIVRESYKLVWADQDDMRDQNTDSMIIQERICQDDVPNLINALMNFEDENEPKFKEIVKSVDKHLNLIVGAAAAGESTPTPAAAAGVSTPTPEAAAGVSSPTPEAAAGVSTPTAAAATPTEEDATIRKWLFELLPLTGTGDCTQFLQSVYMGSALCTKLSILHTDDGNDDWCVVALESE